MAIPHSKSTIRPKDFEAIADCLESGLTTSGSIAKTFELEFASKIGANHVSLFSSGPSAFYHVIKSLSLKKEDEILVPDYISPVVYFAIIKAGYKVNLYDNASRGWQSNIDEIKKCVSRRTKVILVNHVLELLSVRSQH